MWIPPRPEFHAIMYLGNQEILLYKGYGTMEICQAEGYKNLMPMRK